MLKENEFGKLMIQRNINPLIKI